MFKLVIQDDEGKTTIVPLIRDEITIGRKEGNTIRLTERNVSRRHARILRNNGEVHIEDLGSYNGIRVNNARIAERVSLRVSDQVQIGDYKLYLKAEGLDQVDDSRTTPIERVEAGPTDSMPAVAPPLGTGVTAPAIATPVPTVPPMIGDLNRPNRTMVAMSDTDPGRSVGPATAAAVAAMTAPGGYGKLVVLSSNFAGKEFELSRPQMIIGRTDENDIVVNHRSISRNHAKLVREPETGRYTISDLQSSNGVRVNGSDYGKVELRRGDVIDLGHVRLRFVEAGEDFVFARDAVITDVPEAGGRRGLVVALIAAIVVLVASVAVYTWRQTTGDSNRRGSVTGNAGGGAGGVALDADDTPAPVDTAAAAVPAAQVPEDAAGSGSPGPRTVEPAAATAKSGDAKAAAARCAELEVNQKWQDLHDCAADLVGLAAKDRSVATKAEEFRQKAVKETNASLAAAKLKDALAEGNLREAQKQIKAIGTDSFYSSTSSEAFRTAEAKVVDENRRKAQALVAKSDCAGVKRLQAQVNGSSTAAVAAAVAGVAAKCVDRTASAPGPEVARPPVVSNPPANPPPPGDTSPKGPTCDTILVDDYMSQAANQFSAGFSKSALSLVVKALGCKQNDRMYRMAVTYACAAHDAGVAKQYYGRVSPQFQPPLVQRCQQENIALP
ncbi:MAG TPA: FHA domain-containing protein [Kofleriaceae bacterium]|jgi:pSer/pThr/pTyr-binding forkhead associated (FHA) protein|nr:FHA domain-containing protein [Kofleriaceae bacterium]